MNDVLLIIPAYNEEGSIVPVVEKVKEFPQYDYIVVDDGSTDSTPDIISRRDYDHITNQENKGLAETMRVGFRYALEQGYRYAVQIDSDGQHDPSYVESMVDKADEGYDVVIGSRLAGKQHFVMGTARRTGSILLKEAIRIRTGQVISDPTSGMRLYDRKAMRFFIRHPEYGPEPSAVARMILSGARVTEVPVVMYDRTYGKSYLTINRASRYMLRELIGILQR